MNRLAKIVGVVGAGAAVVWAMRDRFISVAASREPEPPVFRSTPPANHRSIEDVDGIGPVIAGKLGAAGIADLEKLAGSSPDTVAEVAGVSAARARAWIAQARDLG